MQRHWLWLAIVVPLAAYAAPLGAADDERMIPGDCFVFKAAKTDRTLPIDRIELQNMAVVGKDNRPHGGRRLHLGIQPRNSDDLIPSDITGPCVATAATMTCTLFCTDGATEKQHGQLQITPIGKTKVKLILTAPTTMNACTAGETAFTVPAELVGKAFTLTRRGRSDCFH